jgi:PilZ domain
MSMHRLREFDVVGVSLPESGQLNVAAFDSHVLAMAGTTIALEPMSRSVATRIPERVDDAFLTFVDNGKLIALKGVLSTRGAVGDLRFKVTDPTDRRKATRIGVCLPVSLHWLDTDTRTEALTIDISADGLLVGCAQQLEIDSVADVSISLPGSDDPVQSSAKVVRVEGGNVALQFASDAPEARSRIARFVVERNRGRLRLREQTNDPEDLDF